MDVSKSKLNCFKQPVVLGYDWCSGRATCSGSTGCEFGSHPCFNSLTALGMCTLSTQEMKGNLA